MATMEVWGRIPTFYEYADPGYGVELAVCTNADETDADGNEAPWVLMFGNRRIAYVTREIADALDDEPMRAWSMDVLGACGEAYGWARVSINGSTVWEAEAVQAAREAIAEASAANDMNDELQFPEEQ